ncbi:hypothetical protein CKO_01556 [Citrobacter koseri ATCC BAA-895]|uniref:Uncharacterized protein n=1 Tax=Citrobacter koseri (strain ATCC BAA-895 / CDC 4225-83 / SGSC4696) TaxID=290338 RepID=A8AGS5_CITK8|nr:hypothetical protein CKO_01556 [Citrobacter koseri ATCC BAA-895]
MPCYCFKSPINIMKRIVGQENEHNAETLHPRFTRLITVIDHWARRHASVHDDLS